MLLGTIFLSCGDNYRKYRANNEIKVQVKLATPMILDNIGKSISLSNIGKSNQIDVPTAPIVSEATENSAPVAVKVVKTEPAPMPATSAPTKSNVKKVMSTKKEVLGFTFDGAAYNSVVTNSIYINSIATFSYSTDGTGNIIGAVPKEVGYANSMGINTYAMIVNHGDTNVAKALLENQTSRQNLINNILSTLKSNGYNGVNIDLEGVPKEDRGSYSAFIKELYSALHPQGLTVTASIPAKTDDIHSYDSTKAFDYAVIGQNTDRVAIMAYDEHWRGGQVGPIASIGWIQMVVDYAVSVIPSEKILLGTATYGYDWPSSGAAKSYGIDGINKLAADKGAQILFDEVSKCPHFDYIDVTGIHHVWFENGTSLSYKLDIVINSNLAGIAIWRLGYDNSDYWTSIKTKFTK